MDPTDENNDVSGEFFALCSGLEAGELVTTSNFRLNDVMSAIELLDAKMDMGVGSSHIKSVDDAVSEVQGLYDDDLPMQLAVLDGTLSMMATWLEGSSLATTVWTNVVLSNTSRIQQRTFKAFAAGVNLLVRNIHSLVNSVGNIEELPEDFNAQMLFLGTRWTSRQDVIKLMRLIQNELVMQGSNWQKQSGSSVAFSITHALGARFELITILLEIIGLLVPPEIEDPNFDHKYHHGEFVQFSQGEEPEQSSEVKESARKTKSADDAKLDEKKNDELKKEGEEQHLGEQDYDDEGDDDFDDADSTVQFKPNFVEAAKLAERLCIVAKACATTVKYGRNGPGGVDGDFTWLPAFDSKACIRYISACFPRNVHILPRTESAVWWLNCALRIRDLCLTTPTSIKDLNSLFYFARTFNIGSCVLTRSLLQICMFPTDNHLCGDDFQTVADPIEITLKNTFCPQVLDKNSPVYADLIAQNGYMLFLTYMAKLAISVYSSFGCNLTRQRDRIEAAIEDFGQVQFYASKLEDRIDEVMLESKVVDLKEKNPSFHSVSTFVFNNLLSTVHHYFELGFRMELYVPYEYTYIYWFIGEIEAKWLRTTMERSQEIQLACWNESPLSTTVNQRQLKEKARIEEILKKKLFTNKFNIINQFAISRICDGVVKLTVALIRKGVIREPPGGEEAERLRFERRFEPFETLGPPLAVDYDTFRESTCMDELYQAEIDSIIDNASDCFTSARVHLESLDNSVEKNTVTSQLLLIAKANGIACNLLKMNMQGRQIAWSFTEDCPMYPSLKITKK